MAETKSLTQKAYEQIHKDIIRHELKPGQKLKINELAERYSIGAIPIREALARLVSTLLVIPLNQRGFMVAPISSEDLYDVYETRAHVEVLALGLAMDHADSAWEAQILASFHQLNAFENEDKPLTLSGYETWEQLHRQFNLALLSACQLKYLLKIQAQLYQLTERYRYQWLLAGITKGNKIPYSKNQKKIMNAVLEQDKEKAQTLLFKHYETAREVIAKFYDNATT